MMRKLFILSIVSIIGILFSCQRNGTEADRQSANTLRGRIFVEVGEGYDYNMPPEAPGIMLTSETEFIYPYCNYRIVTDIVRDDMITTVNYSGLYFPEILLPAFGPASSYVDLPLNNGHHIIKFSAYGMMDSYQFDITEESIIVQPLHTDFTAPSNSLFWRFKPNSFVYLFRSSDGNNPHYNQLINSLIVSFNLQEFNYPDYGKLPFRDAAGWPYPDTPPRYFIYQNDDDFPLIGDAYITSWKNEEYRSGGN